MSLQWTNKVDGVDSILAEDINSIASAVIDLENANNVNKSPYIGVNGHWYEWDFSTQAFIDTGVIAQGDTPVKGTDYWTETDKTEIINDVLEALPSAEEASF